MPLPLFILFGGIIIIVGITSIKRPDIIRRIQLGGYTEADFPHNPVMRESVKLLRENPRKWAETPSTSTKFLRLWGYLACFIGSGMILIVFCNWLSTVFP